jgi:hypothetical protein
VTRRVGDGQPIPEFQELLESIHNDSPVCDGSIGLKNMRPGGRQALVRGFYLGWWFDGFR